MVLYAGLMIVDGEPFLIEYNVRMGDPECQTILPRLKTDLFEIIIACCDQNLSNSKKMSEIKKVYALFYVQRVIQKNIRKIF